MEPGLFLICLLADDQVPESKLVLVLLVVLASCLIYEDAEVNFLLLLDFSILALVFQYRLIDLHHATVSFVQVLW